MKFLQPDRAHPLREAYRRFRMEKIRPNRLKRARKARKHLSSPVIAITGSSAKSTTTALLAHLLKAKGQVKTQVYQNTSEAIWRTFLRGQKDQDFTVLELAIGSPGEMETMADLVLPDLVIVTMVGIEHYSAFRSREAIALEKGFLVESLRPDGLALLNGDDPAVMSMATRTGARVITFGSGGHCCYRITDVSSNFPERMSLTISCLQGEFRLATRFSGKHFALSTAAAFAAAVELGMKPEEAAARITSFDPPLNRCSVIEIPNGPIFILDALKAPSETLSLSFEIIASARGARKSIVLGQISDYPGNGRRVYRNALKEALDFADRVILVGKIWNRFLLKNGSEGLQVDDALAAYEVINADMVPGEIILLKGSANFHLERIVLAFREDVRCRRYDCKIQSSCMSCGLYGVPQEAQKSAHRRQKRRLFFKKIFNHCLRKITAAEQYRKE